MTAERRWWGERRRASHRKAGLALAAAVVLLAPSLVLLSAAPPTQGLALCIVKSCGPDTPGVSFEHTVQVGVGDATFERRFLAYVPLHPTDPPGAPAPLMVVLHGSSPSSAEAMELVSQMDWVAEAHGFIVAYPDRPADPSNGTLAWPWFEAANQTRDGIEPRLLVEVVRSLLTGAPAQEHGLQVDPARVYVVGISAGAAFAAVLGATYPDVFHAVGASAGVQYKGASCRTNPSVVCIAEVTHALLTGGHDPDTTGTWAYKAGGQARGRVPLIVFQGMLDPIVPPFHASLLTAQFAQDNDLLDDGTDNDSVGRDRVGCTVVYQSVPWTSTAFQAARRYTYVDAQGNVLMERWMVEQMSHQWSGSEPGTAGSEGFVDPFGPDEGEEMWGFFATRSHAPPPPADPLTHDACGPLEGGAVIRP